MPIGGLAPLADWGSDLKAVPLTTAARLAQATNQTCVVEAVRGAAVSQACAAALAALAAVANPRAVADLDPGIPATAQALRALGADLVALIDARQAQAPDALAEAWADLRTALLMDIGRRALVAPQALALVLPQTEPALVSAYRLYGDAGRADELVRRNGVRHPGAVPGGVTLEVRSV